MTTRLERLLDSIDPDRTLEEVAGRVDDAFDSFQFESATVTQWDAFRVFLIRFMRHLEATVFQVRAMPEASLDFEWGRCVRLLDQDYGKSGQQAAFEIARTGNEGGLHAVLQRLAARVVDEYSENEVAARVGRWWDELGLDKQQAATTEYLEKYGHLFPSELREGSAARIRANFPKVLEEHPRMIQRMRRVLRR